MKLLWYNQPHAITLAHLEHALPNAGLSVTKSFDLQDVRNATTPCTIHAAESCDSAYTVLLVYGGDPQPATLVVQGHSQISWVSLDQSYGQQVSGAFQTMIFNAIAHEAVANSDA